MKKLSKKIKIKLFLWLLMSCQMAAWAWFQSKGGQLADQPYFIFCGMLLLGLIGAGIECIMGKAWGTLVVQIYFFVFTAYGGIVRYLSM